MDRTGDRPSARGRSIGAICLTNLLPVLGVVVLEWSLAAVVALYWLELGALVWWSLVKIPFAERPSAYPKSAGLIGALGNKRGGFNLPRTALTIRVHNLPVLLSAAFVLGVGWLCAGAFGFVVLLETGNTGQLAAEAAWLSILVGGVGILFSRGYSTLAGYFGGGRYRESSAQEAIRGTVLPVLVLAILVVTLPATVGSGVSELLLLGAVVGVKTGVDLLEANPDWLWSVEEEADGRLVHEDAPPARDPIDADLETHHGTVRPSRLGVLVGGLGSRVTSGQALSVGVLVGLLGALAVGSASWRSFALIAIAATAILVAAGLAVDCVGYAVRHATMEYRVGEDVVGYDRLLAAAQWRAPGRAVASAERERTLADRLVGTETVAIDLGERTVRLVHLPDASVVLERIVTVPEEEPATKSTAKTE